MFDLILNWFLLLFVVRYTVLTIEKVSPWKKKQVSSTQISIRAHCARAFNMEGGRMYVSNDFVNECDI
jgi:hypothetical protein